MTDKLVKDSEVQKVKRSQCVQIRQVEKERLAGLFREVSQAVPLAVVTSNDEKLAEAIVGKALKWVMPKG